MRSPLEFNFEDSSAISALVGPRTSPAVDWSSIGIEGGSLRRLCSLMFLRWNPLRSSHAGEQQSSAFVTCRWQAVLSCDKLKGSLLIILRETFPPNRVDGSMACTTSLTWSTCDALAFVVFTSACIEMLRVTLCMHTLEWFALCFRNSDLIFTHRCLFNVL